MTQVVVVGCGVVGAAIAYVLSQVPRLNVSVVDRQPPAQAATGAALGVLMGAISQKLKGRNLQMRLAGIQSYNDWVPRLEALTGRQILFNRQGILRLCFAGEDLAFWQHLAQVRQSQGWKLEIHGRDRLQEDYPQLNLERVNAAIYSPQDRQIDPVALTLALVDAAKKQGAEFNFAAEVTAFEVSNQHCYRLHTTSDTLAADWLVIAAGLGSTPLTAHLQQSTDIRPVLGQAIEVQLRLPLGHSHLQPVITGNDVHIVPLSLSRPTSNTTSPITPAPNNYRYWVGATVEFPTQAEIPVADEAVLRQVMREAIALCPALADGDIVRTWSGLRPRPQGRPAPIVEPLSGYDNVLLATGHYRNGVLLAPATAEMIRQMIK